VEHVKISEELYAFRERIPGCSVVLFADLSTGMVLASNSAEKIPQEKLDALCLDACDALKSVEAAAVAEVAFGCQGAEPDVAFRTDGRLVKCFVRLPGQVEEALCFIVSGPAVSENSVEEASVAIRRILSETS
jgi:hypothetical protein